MKKGFTLIELLAVIVILAIIALIATPIVLNIINDASESSILRTAEFYIDAVEYTIADAYLHQSVLHDGKYPIDSNGNLCKVSLNNGSCPKESTLNVEVNREKPSSGYVTITNKNIKDLLIELNSKKIIKNKKGELIIVEEPKSFAEDSWEVISTNVRIGNLSKYKVGDTKEVKLENFTNEEKDLNEKNIETYTVRIANISTKEECNTEGFSQTACGFVVEFVDIIAKQKMNLDSLNSGGWEACKMREYLNNEIYSVLPGELKNNIIDTYVVSGYEINKTENYKTIDKLYLLSTKEVWGAAQLQDEVEETRQLDYYKNKGVTLSIYSDAIKNYNGSALNWWLRSAYSINGRRFYSVVINGDWSFQHAAENIGVSPAFRL